jgi:hypothetical protein
MRKHLRTLAGLAMLLTTISAAAQVGHRTTVTVPFPFVAGKTLCPAGEYQMALDMGNGIVKLTSEGMAPAALLTSGSESLQDSRTFARFRHVGEQWFLEQVAVAGQAQSVALPKASTRASEIATAYGREGTVTVSESRATERR